MAATTNLSVGSNLLPKTSGNINLGDSTHKWVIDASQLSGTVSADRLATSGATAGSYGEDGATRVISDGDTFKVPQVTVDNKGRVTGASTKTMTLKAGSNAVVMSSTEPTADDCLIWVQV